MTEVSRYITKQSLASLTGIDLGHPQPQALRSSPLSPSQHQIWLSEQIDPGDTTYHMAELYSLTGKLEPSLLESSFNEVVRRHEALRTVMREENDEPLQVVQPFRPFSLEIIDLSDLSEADRESAIAARVREEVNQPFDLTSGPLIRTVLIRLEEQLHYLSLVMHHIVSDGWSLGILMREIQKLYTGFVRREPEALPELPIHYADFVNWQRERLSGAEGERHLSYWRQRLAGLPPLLEIPADHSRPIRRSARGARATLTLPDELTARVREFGPRAGGTLFMTLLAAFEVLLSRYTGREDIVVGTPLAGRGRTEFENLIGLFVNTLVLRTDLSGAPSFLDVFRRLRDGFLHDYEHQDVPIETLISELKIERNLGYTPLVQVLFNMMSFSVTNVELPGLRLERLSAPETASKFDLTLYAHTAGQRQYFTLLYNLDLFDESRMCELLQQFQRVLEQAVENPKASIAQYSLVTPAARKLLPDPTLHLQTQWEGTSHTLFSRQAAQTPDQPALIEAQQTWSYQELDERSNQLAHWLLAAGVRRGDPVAIYAHRSASLVCAVLGILKAGAAFVILDPAYPEHRLVECLRAAQTRALVHLNEAGPRPHPFNEFTADDLPLCRLHSDTLTNPTTDPGLPIRSDDLAYVAFTSGSTGTPKGVMGTHGSLVHYPNWIREAFGIGATDRFSMLSALSHDPLLRDIFTPLLLGAALCIPDEALFQEPGALARWMRDTRISVSNLTPAMGKLLNELPPDISLELTDLRHAFFVGESLTRHDVSRFKRLAPFTSCINLYGSTETQRALGYYIVPADSDTHSRKEILPVGKGIDNVQLLVLNGNHDLAGIGETGEIHFRSPHLAHGYLNDPLLTAQRFVPNPFAVEAGERLYKSGDLGRYLPDGNVEILGRTDRQLKIRGFRVEPAEVQSALKECAGIRECVAVPIDDVKNEKQLVAYIVPGTEVAPNLNVLGQQLRTRLPAYMVPSAFVTMKSLPLTPSGKIDYQALPAPEQRQSEIESGYRETGSPVEEVIAGMLANLLKLEQVGFHDNFFELGGHSLLAMQLLSKVRSSFRVKVALREVFETPTVAGLAKWVESRLQSQVATGLAPIPRYPAEAEPPLSFSQEGLLVREWWEEVNGLPRRPSQLSAAARLTGPLDLRLFERAIGQMVQRHDILRATFPRTRGPVTWKGVHFALRLLFATRTVHNRMVRLEKRSSSNRGFSGGRKQIICPEMTVPLHVIDLERVRGIKEQTEISRILGNEAAVPFDYDTGPLFRIIVVRLANDEHVIQFVVHHLICDAWSMRVLVKETLMLYSALAAGQPSPLPELPIQYADFTRWQREWFQGETLEKTLSYWREQIAKVGLFPKLPIPFVHAQKAKTDTQGSVEIRHLTIPSGLSKSLKTLGRARGVTSGMLFMAALSALLYRYTRVPTISLYTPFANRGHVETEDVIGWVSNVHVLSIDCAGDPSFSELLERVREAVLGAYAQQEVPYVHLVKTLLREKNGYAIPRSVSEAPYVFFDHVVQSLRVEQAGPLTIRPFPLPPGSAAAGLSGLEVRTVEQGDDLTITIKYSSNAVDGKDIEQMLADFAQLLECVARDAEQQIRELRVA
jgi:amino acid adenylation domain-containing protein